MALPGGTLVNGTLYTMASGRPLINGTGYEIAKGKTLIEGTSRDIRFNNKVVLYSKGTEFVPITVSAQSGSAATKQSDGISLHSENSRYWGLCLVKTTNSIALGGHSRIKARFVCTMVYRKDSYHYWEWSTCDGSLGVGTSSAYPTGMTDSLKITNILPVVNQVYETECPITVNSGNAGFYITISGGGSSSTFLLTDLWLE